MSEQPNPSQPKFDTLRFSLPISIKTGFKLDPRDLSITTPRGNGVYGLQEPERLPFHNAPPQDAEGGVIHFSDRVSKPDFEALTRILHIGESKPPYSLQYAAFLEESQNPKQDGYLKQMRLVSSFGLQFLFRAIKNDANFPQQPMNMTDALWAFMEAEKKKWEGDPFDIGNPKLYGAFGGDGDYAREALSFGLMVENSYHGVYRIWSRAWLVTK